MNEKTLGVLEYDKVIQLLKQETATSIGRDLARELTPETDIEIINTLQSETDEAIQIIRQDKTIPFSHITDISSYIKRSVIGSMLNTKECLEIAQVIYCGKNIKSYIQNLEIEIPLLKENVEDLAPLKELEQAIITKIDEHGEVMDSASSKLKSIRSSIRTSESRIRERLNQLTRTKSKMLSDAIVTIRNNRYVLPVKSEYRSAIGGIVHDHSSSGQTLFMEPNAIIELNNQLQQAVIDEKQEIEVILQELTNKVANHADVLERNVRIIARVDFISARGRLAAKMKAARPKLNEQGIIKVKEARHPLIPASEVVANDISIGETYHAIVITGPNTGGKTVTLKMVGLMVLMAQSGLQIPALDGCELAVFKKIYADIGDEQSIEQNLSTFSSHMTNIVSIMESVDEESLVLFDELGSGTDPQEGAALAMAILDEAIGRKACVIATTHYPELKAYGYNREHVMNASVEFDIETLRPTYRLLLGIPGKSNAFEISKRLGLESEIIDHAKAFIGVDTKNVENMIGALEQAKQEAERELEEVSRLQAESEAIRRQLEDEQEKFEKTRDDLYRQAEEKAEAAIKKAREEAEIIVDEVRHMKDQSLWKEHEWIEAKRMLDEAKPTLRAKKSEAKEIDTTILEIGDEITHKKLHQPGEVVKRLNDDEYIIQIGMMKVNVKREDLIFKKRKKAFVEENKFQRANVVTADRDVKMELDLRGIRYEEALLQVEKYIDDAIVQGLARVTIIHGKGTGALRKGVEEYLKTHPMIKAHRLGANNEGGSGVTIVELS